VKGARIAFGPTNYALFGAAVLTIGIGYLLLGRGSITLAPILLVLGYLVFLPAGILVRRDFSVRRSVSVRRDPSGE
jgi:hypothetical protein